MTVIALPSIPWNTSFFQLVRGDIPIRLMSGAEVVVENFEALWALSFSLAPRTKSESRVLGSRLMQLARLSNVFEHGPPAYTLSSGYAGAAPLVKGTAQLGTVLEADGVTINTLIVQEGDYMSFTIGSNVKLFRFTADSTSDGVGNVTFNYEPPLLDSPADNAPIEIDAPITRFRMVEATSSESVDLAAFRTMNIAAVESFTP